VCVLIQHHPRKEASADGQSARGTGALCGHVDVLLEMHWFQSADSSNRRRRLLAWSRHESTPRHRLIELSEDGRDYVLVADLEGEEMRPLRELLWRVLEQASTKLTQAQIAEGWPPERPKPPKTSLWRLLDHCVERGELLRDGEGVRLDPYRYWLPSLEERWRDQPHTRMWQNILDAQRDVLNLTRSPFEGP
jgi:hypothetical protein